MSNSLNLQTRLAADFIHQSWNEIQQCALEVADNLGEGFREIHIAGCGDSYYAGLGLELAFNHWTKFTTRAGTALQIGRYRVPELSKIHRKALVIAISASGEVSRTLEVIELAKAAGLVTLGFTSESESNLADIADTHLSIPIPELSHGPGLLSYLGSLLMGYALCLALASASHGKALSEAMETVPAELERWIAEEESRGDDLAENIASRDNIVFLGSGPDRSSAMFSAAKVVEACGIAAWGQDLEEWAHIEYFLEPASMPTWLLSANGRSIGREKEIEAAAAAIGRRFFVSRWTGWDGLDRHTREAISPLFLWAGPCAYAAKLSAILEEEPFRGFGGGRSREGGGGPSRIRSSERISSIA